MARSEQLSGGGTTFMPNGVHLPECFSALKATFYLAAKRVESGVGIHTLKFMETSHLSPYLSLLKLKF